MTTHADMLRSSINTWAAAYIQFATGEGREHYLAYAFVEDDDDTIFYQHALSNIDGICFLGCGGKSAVVAVFKKLFAEGRSNKSMFFVDRDTESEPFEFGADILRTEMYSWESHVCQTDTIKWLLGRGCNPNLNALEVEATGARWAQTVENFRPQLSAHSSLLRTALVLNASLGLSAVSITRNALTGDGLLAPGPNALDWHSEKLNLAFSLGANESDIERRRERYQAGTPLREARGKMLFSILKLFIIENNRLLKRVYRGEFNSAKHLVRSMRWDDRSTDYIRDYAVKRLDNSTQIP